MARPRVAPYAVERSCTGREARRAAIWESPSWAIATWVAGSPSLNKTLSNVVSALAATMAQSYRSRASGRGSALKPLSWPASERSRGEPAAKPSYRATAP